MKRNAAISRTAIRRTALASAAVFLAAAWLAATGPAAPARAGDGAAQPVVVELFTSQGCYSCPPADAYLTALSAREGVLALSFHVDYWNYLGWRDPFSSKAATARQRAYAWRMRRASVYTPQMVVDGRYQAVGSNRGAVDAAIRKARRASANLVDITLTRVAGGMLDIGVTPGRKPERDLANLYLVLFDKARTTEIPRGENAGKTLTYTHVVRDFRMVGDYAGQPVRTRVSLKADGAQPRGEPAWGAALLVQRPRGGRIIGAAFVTGDTQTAQPK